MVPRQKTIFKDVTETRMVSETVTRKVPVEMIVVEDYIDPDTKETKQRSVKKTFEKVEQYTISKPVTETKKVPYTVCEMVPETYTERVPVQVQGKTGQPTPPVSPPPELIPFGGLTDPFGADVQAPAQPAPAPPVAQPAPAPPPPEEDSFLGNTRVAVTIVFPQGGEPKNRAAILNFLKLLSGGEVFEKKQGQRTFFSIKKEQIIWWQEGEHIVLRLANEPVSRAIDVAEGRRPNLTSSSIYQKVAGFKSYETDIRGCIDVDRIIDMLRQPSKSQSPLDSLLESMARSFLLEYSGANDIHGLTFHMGFSGKFQRSTIMLHVAERSKRAGLVKYLLSPPSRETQEAFDLSTFPAMPADAGEVTALQVDWLGLYDYVVRSIRLFELAQALPAGRVPHADIERLDQLLDFNFRDDFLASLDNTVVTFGAHSEGPSLLGQALAIKIKDAKKLSACLQKLNKHLADSGLGLDFQKRPYHGTDLFVLSASEGQPGALPIKESLFSPGLGFVPLAPTFTIHKDWLLMAPLPQPIMGCILREGGKRKAWQPPPYYKELLAQDLKEGGPQSRLAGVTVINPVFDIEIGLAFLPTLASLSNAAPESISTSPKFPTPRPSTKISTRRSASISTTARPCAGRITSRSMFRSGC